MYYLLTMSESTQTERAGRRLRAFRLDKGVNVQAAADEMGVSIGTLRRLESGSGGIPQADTALKVARFYGVRPSQIWMPAEASEMPEAA